MQCIFFFLFIIFVPLSSALLWGMVTSAIGKVMDMFTPTEGIDDDTIRFFLFNGSATAQAEGRSANSYRKGNIYVIIHGYKSGRNSSWYKDLTEQILNKRPDAHVVQLSWEGLASKLYSISKRHAESIGSKLAKIILDLGLEKGVDPSRFVLIGHSLGAQISGWAGRFYRRITGRKLRRIIALDPAQPLFKNVENNGRLNPNDAQSVIVVHTDSFFGYLPPCGTLDFYVNGGQYQHFCRFISSWQEKFYCSHSSSYKYFIDALSHPDFYLGQECDTLEDCKKGIVRPGGALVSMGDLQLEKTGLFYVKTPNN